MANATTLTAPPDFHIDPLADVDGEAVLRRLSDWPHPVWLDSASDHDSLRGRYSFLTADPVGWSFTRLDEPDPWPQFADACDRLSELASSFQPFDLTLPPFLGGLVALIGYEAAWWLEPTLRQPISPTPPIGIAWGLYDWVIAIDHRDSRAWLVSTGLGADFKLNRDRADQRADEVHRRLRGPVPAPRQAVASGLDAPPAGHPTRVAGVTSNFTEAGYRKAVADIVGRICRGDSFQVNLSQRLRHPATTDAVTLYQRLRRASPAPYAAYVDLGVEQVMSSSPEAFLKVRGRTVTTRPIKGTVPATGDAATDQKFAEQLLASEKDRAENVMIVDLMRNDFSRVCTDASVRVTGLCEVETYQHVQHLVSTVAGQLRDEATIAELVGVCFPGGSITGAPKVEAMRTIRQLERVDRGAYCGSLGYVSVTGDADFNLLIRTISQRDGVWSFPVGGGVTARSQPDHELDETWNKAAGMIAAIVGPSTEENE